MSAAPEAADLLVADIGSTLTKLSAFGGLGDRPRFLGQGVAVTSVAEGDVTLGLDAARHDLETRCKIDTAGAKLMASASAAGGLRMTVHGLTRDMTLRAAREASLGAGAIVVLATAGVMGPGELESVRRLKPKLILLAGGVDDGDRRVATANAEGLAASAPKAPIVYAGNVAARGEVEAIFKERGLAVFSVDNVYPRIDELNVEPVRRVIRQLFAEHIVTAPGMDKVKHALSDRLMPTPAAVMTATELLAEALGDVMTVDVGGATTDVHSVTEGSPKLAGHLLAPEPRSKRTVEGDLGVYINARHVLEAAGEELAGIEAVQPLPEDERTRAIAVRLTRLAVDLAVWRHAGELRPVYGALGRESLVEGRDLTAIEYVVGTGGALIRLGEGKEILETIRRDPRERMLLPPTSARVLLDHDYIMAPAGVLSQRYSEDAKRLLFNSLGVKG